MSKNPKQKQKKKQSQVTKKEEIKNKYPFFAHLDKTTVVLADKSVYPFVEKMGILMSTYQIIGANARSVGVINCIIEWAKVADKSQLMPSLNHQLNYINSCRTFGISIGNTVRFIKNVVNKHSKVFNRLEVQESLENYKDNRIYKAMDQIQLNMKKNLMPFDVILIHGKSSTVLSILKSCISLKLKVIIVNSEPLNEGLAMSIELNKLQIINEVIDISSCSDAVALCDKVVLGAHAMLANGSLISRSGSGIIATVAKFYCKPVVVCCETYKFSDKIYLDSISWNELYSMETNPPKKAFDSVNCLYDIVPEPLLSMICSDIGCIPPTSIPVAIREDRQMTLQYE